MRFPLFEEPHRSPKVSSSGGAQCWIFQQRLDVRQSSSPYLALSAALAEEVAEEGLCYLPRAYLTTDLANFLYASEFAFEVA
jgi:hypothetical protein